MLSFNSKLCSEARKLYLIFKLEDSCIVTGTNHLIGVYALTHELVELKNYIKL